MREKLGQSQTVEYQKSNFYQVLREGKKAWSRNIMPSQDTVSEVSKQVHSQWNMAHMKPS